MSQSIRSRVVLAAMAALGVAGLWYVAAGAAEPTKPADKPGDAAVERARKQVRMLDDLYKTAVVLITEHYVKEDSDLSAGSAAKALFKAMKEKGWHEVRLLDATGKPIDEDNVAKDDFEKEAIKQITSGKAYYDRVVEGQNGRKLRAATAIPVVMKKCVMCHDHYQEAKNGAAIGALSYTLPIE